ncbi:phosphorothioated DNA-binding restriction endonuclease [Kitasatospora sp. NPDC059673]|uniref:phosphorothioated DNA-binding restriction endonuclease n=1 Tax=Kitasatospora sp. NPDC059673 TaxID=3346901 RepID=UPI0036D0BB0F
MTVRNPPRTSDELLATLKRLRRSGLAGGGKAPHKPLLLLHLIGQLAAAGTSETTFEDVAEPLGELIARYAPSGRADPRERAALPFVRLEEELWETTDRWSRPLPREAGGDRLIGLGARGRLRPDVERLLLDPAVRGPAITLLLAEADPSGLEQAVQHLTHPLGEERYRTTTATRRVRDSRFARAVLELYQHACAFCRFGGRLGGVPVGVEAAHVHAHGQGGPDVVQNGLALCALHHALFDCGVLGLTNRLTVAVSPHYTPADGLGAQVLALDGTPAAQPADPALGVEEEYRRWHTAHVFQH